MSSSIVPRASELQEIKQFILSGGVFDKKKFKKLCGALYDAMSSGSESEAGEDLKDEEMPEEFICPITKNIMSDPVVIASGQTFERTAIVNWRKSGRRTCPRTNEFLFHNEFTPNHLLRKLILKWCKSHGIQEPDEPPVEEQPTKQDHAHFTSLHLKLSAMGPSEQKKAAKQLCQLTTDKPVFRALYAESPESVPQLLNVLDQTESDSEIDPELHEDVITIMSNILTDERNKKHFAECHMSIPVLIQALEAKKLETRCKAAAAIHLMSSLDSNKELIGNSCVLEHLIELLKVKGSLNATRDAMNAISSLCENEANAKEALKLSVVFVIAEKFVDKTFVDLLLPILTLFSSHKRACEELESLKFVPVLLTIVKNNPSDVSKENAISILHNIFETNRRNWKEMVRGAEENRGTIIQISQSGTPKTKKKANAILENLNKDTATSSSSPTA